LIGPAALAAIVFLLLCPIALGRSFWLRDMLTFLYPLKAYLRERMLAGELALWNPRLGLGRPFLGVVQPGVFYPLDVILLLPYPRGVDLFYGVHALIAAFGARAWVRARGGDEAAAVLGGAIFALSGYYVSQLAGNASYAVGAAWIPWALAALERLRDDPGRAASLGAIWRIGLYVGLMVLGGDPQAAWLAAGLLLVAAATLAPRRRAFLVIGAGLLLAAMLAAVQLGPAGEVARVGRPHGVALTEAMHFSFPPLRLFELWWPGLFGEPYTDDWLIHPLYDEGTGVPYEPFAAGVYLGLATPLLALAALQRRRAADLALAGVGLAALALAFGRHAPFFAPFFRFAPGASLFRYPEKYLLVTTLCAAALAAKGLDRATAHPKRALAVGGAALALLAIGWAWAARAGGAFLLRHLGHLSHGTVADAGGAFAGVARTALLVGAATLAPIALAAAGRLSPRALKPALVAIVIADLFAQSVRLNDWVPSSIYRETPPPIAAARALAGPGTLRIYRPQYFVFEGAGMSRALTYRAMLRPNCGIEEGVALVEAYDPFELPSEQALWKALRPHPLRLLAVTSTRFALLPQSLYAARPGFVERKRWPPVGAVLAEATATPPRAYLATDARVADDETAARLIDAPEFVPGRSALLAPADGAADAHAEGACTLVEDRPEQLRLGCHASAPAYAVVADAWFPGWSATVDGRAAPLLRANLAMRAVRVPVGDSTVELRYRPAHLVAGAVASLLALAAILALWARERRQRRRALSSDSSA